ncbi:MAG: ATP-binding cassette domain-containing protein [Alphaproteobacteria bacterium]
MLILSHMTIQMGIQLLLDDASTAIADGIRVGIVGKNGCGKSTLFKVILGQLESVSGEVEIPPNKKIAYVEQEIQNLDTPILQFVLSRDRNLMHWRQKLEQASPEELPEIMEQLSFLGSDSAEAKVAEILSGLGFSQSDLSRPVHDFSGGWRMRLALAGALFQPSDYLLLDEPTNHLDLEAVLWLGNYLKKYTGTLLIISHDKDFLNNICDHILHFEGKKLVLYKGNFDTYQSTFTLKRENQIKMAEKQQEKRAHLQSYIDRFRYKTSKAKQAQSRIKMLAKLQDEPIVDLEPTDMFSFPETELLPAPCMKIQEGAFSYVPGTVILKNLNLSIGNNDRIALLGKNGNGKSTLAKLMAGQLILDSGQVIKSSKFKVGFFNQHQNETLPSKETPVSYLSPIMPGKRESEIRSYVARFGLTAEKAITKIGLLSGGEKARLLLAKICLDKPQILILDEPTNHLDMQGREALADVLNTYNGSVILITHDFHILKSVCDTLWIVDNHTCKEFSGDLQDYKNQLLGLTEKQEPIKVVEKSAPKKDKTEKLPYIKKHLKELEKQVEALHAEREALIQSLLQPDQHDFANIQKQIKKLEMQISQAENEWMQWAEKMP